MIFLIILKFIFVIGACYYIYKIYKLFNSKAILYLLLSAIAGFLAAIGILIHNLLYYIFDIIAWLGLLFGYYFLYRILYKYINGKEVK